MKKTIAVKRRLDSMYHLEYMLCLMVSKMHLRTYTLDIGLIVINAYQYSINNYINY